MKPTISILVPNYNHAPFLQRRLDSVFQQTYQDVEVILLDDASTDGSDALLKKYQDHPKVSHLLLNTTNSGSPFKQWQKGMERAKGEWIWIAESDDYCEPDFLATLIAAAQNHIGLVYAQTTDVDEQETVLLNREVYTANLHPNYWQGDFEMNGIDFIKKGLLVKNVIPNASAVLFKRSLVHPSVFSEDLLRMRMCGDWFFWIKVCEQTSVSFVAKPLNYFRNHEGITRNHHSNSIRKARIYEEAQLRDYLNNKLGIRNKDQEINLLLRWFHYFPILSIFSKEFYEIYPLRGSKLKLAVDFIKHKIKKKLS